MKKLFTLFVAMAFTTMSFAQLIKMPLPENAPAVNSELRTDWYGFTDASRYIFPLPAASKYCLRVPANAINAGTTIEQVKFEHVLANALGPGYETYTNNEYTIEIYEGGSWSMDTAADPWQTANEGTLMQTQTYVATEEGYQNVTLTTPYVVKANTEFWVVITVTNDGCLRLCNDQEGGIENPRFGECLLWMNTEESPGWWQYVFGEEPIYNFCPFFLSILANDGVPYSPKSDFYVEMYQPGDVEQFPDAAENVLVDEWADSIRIYFGSFNNGVDPFYGTATWALTCDQMPDPSADLLEGELTQTYSDDGEGPLPVNWGIRFPDNPIGAAIFAVPFNEGGHEDWDTYGLQFPLELCITVHTTSSNGGSDPNPDNDMACITYDINPTGISESNMNGIAVYPNPANSFIHIDHAAGAQIILFNLAGQEMMNIAAAQAGEKIDVSDLAEGVYMVRVIDGTKVSTSKISIVR